MFRAIVAQHRVDHLALRHHLRATRMKGAPRRRIDGAGHFAAQDDAQAATRGIGLGDRRQQRLRVGMLGVLVDLLAGRSRRSGPGTSRRLRRKVLHDGEVVGDEEVARPMSRCRSSSRLRICDWIETSRALTGSSQTMKSGLEGEGAGDADALPLAAGEFVRVAARVGRVEAARCSSSATSSSRRSASGDAVHVERFADDAATVMRGFRLRDRVLEDDLHVAAQAGEVRRPR